MSHAVSNHISTSTTLPANATPLQIVMPKTDGRISAGVNNDQLQALVVNQAVTGASTALQLQSATTPWTASAYVGHIVEVIAGTNLGQSRTISANSTSRIDVDVDFPAPNDATTRFNVREPSRSCVVVKGWTIEHTATAGTIRLQSRGFVGTTLTTRTLLVFVNAAATGFNSQSGFSFVALPGTDIRTARTAAMTGTLTLDAYFLHDSITAILDN